MTKTLFLIALLVLAACGDNLPPPRRPGFHPAVHPGFTPPPTTPSYPGYAP